MSENRAKFNKTIAPGLFMMATDSFEKYPDDWRKLMTIKKSTKAYEEIAYMSSLGLAVKKAEGTSISYDERIQGPKKKWVHDTWGLGLRITEEAIEDDLYGVMEGGSSDLGESMAESLNIDCFSLFNDGDDTGTSADGHYIFATAHHKLDGTTYSNLYTASTLSIDSIQDDVAAYEALTDHRGKFINRRGGISLIVANPALEWKLAEIFGTVSGLDTPYGNKNTLISERKGLSFMVTPYITSTTARFYIGPKSPIRGPIFFSRRSPTFAREGDFNTGDALFKVTARWSTGVADPMNIAANLGA
jgi:hypothetical protein